MQAAHRSFCMVLFSILTLNVLAWSPGAALAQVTCPNPITDSDIPVLDGAGMAVFAYEEIQECQRYEGLELRLSGLKIHDQFSQVHFLRVVQGYLIEGVVADFEVLSGSCSFSKPRGNESALRGGGKREDCRFRVRYQDNEGKTVTLTGEWNPEAHQVRQLQITGGAFAGQGRTAVPAVSCKPHRFRRATSDHTWVDFSLPAGTAGQVVTLPGGVRNKYVFPKCNRVWWDEHKYRCGENGSWNHQAGNAGADILCHGGTPSCPYIVTGER